MKSLVAFVTLFVGASLATKFEKCGNNELCFKTKFKQAIVTIGDDGTDDDVFMEICSDRDASQCCKSKALDALLTDDWKRRSTQTWGVKYFPGCDKVVFKIERGFRVTLSKNSKKGDDSLKVKSIQIDTFSPDKNDKEQETFLCRDYSINKAKSSQTKFCKTHPYHFGRINDAVVTIGNGREDGTSDNVKIKICSDVNTGPEGCCEKKLSHTFSSEWQRGKVETWPRSQFGDCQKRLFKIRNNPVVSVIKDGKDDLKVSKFVVSFIELLAVPKKHTYTCDGFHISGTCSNAAVCTVPLNNCKKKTTNASLKNQTTTKKPKRTTTRRTTRKSSSGFKATTNPTGIRTTPKPTVTTTKKGILSKIFGR